MSTCSHVCVSLSLAILLLISQSQANVVLYNQNFENPVGFVNDGGDVNFFKTVG